MYFNFILARSIFILIEQLSINRLKLLVLNLKFWYWVSILAICKNLKRGKYELTKESSQQQTAAGCNILEKNWAESQICLDLSFSLHPMTHMSGVFCLQFPLFHTDPSNVKMIWTEYFYTHTDKEYQFSVQGILGPGQFVPK